MRASVGVSPQDAARGVIGHVSGELQIAPGTSVEAISWGALKNSLH
jgi:hypothetical protein